MDAKDIRSIPIVMRFLIDPGVLERLEGVQTRYGLPVDRADEYLVPTQAVLDGDITLEHMPELVAEAFGVDAEKAKKIACDVAGLRLLPLEKYFPGTEKQIEAWGGKLSDYPDTRVGKEKVTSDRFAGRLTEELGLTLQPNHIKRLGFLLKGYFAGEKTRDTTLTFFSRAATIGGLALPADLAKTLIEAADANKEMVELVDDPKLETFAEEEEDEVVAETVGADISNAAHPEADAEGSRSEAAVPAVPVAPVPAAPSTPNVPEIAPSHEVATTTPVTPKVAFAKPVDEHAAEIAQHEKKAARVANVAEGVDARLNNAVEVAVDAASEILHTRRVAKKKFADVARLAIRGVREPMQTRGVLEKDLGFTDPDLDVLMAAIEKGSAAMHGVSTPTSVPPAPPVEHTAAEQDVLDKRFAEVTKTVPPVPVEPVLPSARVSAARTKEDEIASQVAKVDPQKLAVAAEASKPEPARAVLTVGSVPPPVPGETKVVTDVQFRPRLVGPVEELGTMSPADFRRLSSDPAEAGKKIEDLLGALESTSYEDRIRGITAWRQSPMHRLYVAMAEEALNEGIALAEIASRRRNKGEESLSPAEMKAVGSLNARIRF